MFFGAISTDIKKSSTLWANLSEWMEEAVQKTNNITEYIFRNSRKDGINQHILPNSPEGDAWTIVYECSDQTKLKEHVKNVAHFLQYIYKLAREKKIIKLKDDEKKDIINQCKDSKAKQNKEEYFESASVDEWKTAIFVRIGVAFSDTAPIKYKYVANTPNRNFPYISYWESVVKESERAEEQAPYKSGIAVTQPGEKVKEDTLEKQKDWDDIFKYEVKGGNRTALLELEKSVFDEKVLENKYIAEAVNGYMIFIHYHLSISMDKVKRSPHMYNLLIKEFKTVHEHSVKTLKDAFGDEVFLVKVKRSSDSMFYLKPETAPSSVWNKCLSLCAALPEKSSIGIAFTNCGDYKYKTNFGDYKKKEYYKMTPTGSLKRLTAKNTDIQNVKKVDYFGDCVNLSARMDTLDFEYDTKWFRPAINTHHSRVAMCNADQRNKGWAKWGAEPGSKKTHYIHPLKIEDIPRSSLNAGTDTEVLRVISAHVYSSSSIQFGDTVYWKMKGGKFVDQDSKDGKTYYGRVTSVNYMSVYVEKIDKQWPTDFDGWVNITYVKKDIQEKLTPEAEALSSSDEEDDHGISKPLFSLKF